MPCMRQSKQVPEMTFLLSSGNTEESDNHVKLIE